MRHVSGTLLLASGIIVGLLLADRWASEPPRVSAAPQVTAPGRGPVGNVLADDLPDLTAVANRAVAAAANIAARTTTANPMSRDPMFDFFFGGRVPSTIQSESLGSGVIVSEDGYVLTNQHVVGDSRAEVSVTLPDNRELAGRVVGVDELTDLAVIKVDATGLAPLPWGDSDQLQLAQWVLAVGNPFALDHSVSLGIVSAVGRASPDLSPYTNFIQTDAAINPGNSGGALVNGRGELVGINNAIASRTGGYQGISFAIPANLARRVMAELIEHGEVRWGSLDGVSVQGLTSALAQRVGTESLSGVAVVQMWDDSAAYDQGLRPGDVIRSFNNQPVEDYTQFARLLADTAPGTTARLEVTRRTRAGEERFTFDVPVVPVGRRR
jgi:S1-C subfamily serine protease